MSETTLKQINRVATETAIHACWAQWRALGAPGASASGSPAKESIIDLEGLLLLSFVVLEEERRLRDIVGWWARAGAKYLSIYRLRAMADLFPNSARAGLETFASHALDAGDRRWRSLAASEPGFVIRPDKGRDHPRLTTAPALMGRFRAAFGVGVKSDLLTFLLGTPEHTATTTDILEAVFYSGPAIRTAARDLVLAGFVREESGRPTSFRIAPRPWASLIRDSTWPGRRKDPGNGEFEIPSWRYWPQLWAFLADVAEWSQEGESGDGIPDKNRYLISTEARDLHERHANAFELNGLDFVGPDDVLGEQYAAAFQDSLESMSLWVEKHL